MFAVASQHIFCRWIIWVCALLAVVPGCSNTRDTDPPTVVILGAASTKDLLEDIAAAAKTSLDTPVTIEISSGPSHALAQQILSGAPADLFVSANRQWAEAVVDADMASESVDWLANTMVVVVPTSSKLKIASLEDLTSADVQRIALAGENVPAGIYAKEALTYAKLWEPLSAAGKIIRGHDVRSALAYAQRGEVDAAIVYATDARLSEDVRVVARLDPASHAPIVYPLVRIRSGSPESEQVYQFFLGSEARQIAQRHGFQMLVTDRVKE